MREMTWWEADKEDEWFLSDSEIELEASETRWDDRSQGGYLFEARLTNSFDSTDGVHKWIAASVRELEEGQLYLASAWALSPEEREDTLTHWKEALKTLEAKMAKILEEN